MTTEAGGGDGGEGQQKVVYRVPTPASPAPPTLRERVLTEDRKRNTVYYNIHPAAAAGNGHFISDPKEQRHVGGREYSRAQPVRNTWRFNTQRRRAGGGGGGQTTQGAEGQTTSSSAGPRNERSKQKWKCGRPD